MKMSGKMSGLNYRSYFVFWAAKKDVRFIAKNVRFVLQNVRGHVRADTGHTSLRSVPMSGMCAPFVCPAKKPSG
jgi:hypothetical protein